MNVVTCKYVLCIIVAHVALATGVIGPVVSKRKQKQIVPLQPIQIPLSTSTPDPTQAGFVTSCLGFQSYFKKGDVCELGMDDNQQKTIGVVILECSENRLAFFHSPTNKYDDHVMEFDWSLKEFIWPKREAGSWRHKVKTKDGMEKNGGSFILVPQVLQDFVQGEPPVLVGWYSDKLYPKERKLLTLKLYRKEGTK